MGIITQLYYRNERLPACPFDMLFLDMGENIHIHYRDLRIELSVDEFLEFQETFARHADRIKDVIQSSGYRDGVLPNTNESNTLTTVSDQQPLEHGVRYHPQRLSVEKNIDGYHVHFRNYKILLDKTTFDAVVDAFRAVGEASAPEHSVERVLHLFDVNELAYTVLGRRNTPGGEAASVLAAQRFIGKCIQVLEGLGFARRQGCAARVFERGGLAVALLKSNFTSRQPKGDPVLREDPTVVPLMRYLECYAPFSTPDELNVFKLEILDHFEYVKQHGLDAHVELSVSRLLYDRKAKRLVCPSRSAPKKSVPSSEYGAISNHLHGLELFFIKPTKVLYEPEQQATLADRFTKAIMKTIACHEFVRRIHLLGSSVKGHFGYYKVPFVHFDWAKMASDVDILIEMEEGFEGPLPDDWRYLFPVAYCDSDYCHLGEVPLLLEPPECVSRFPNIPFRRHLIEAYVFWPGKGNKDVKDRYLKGSQAVLIYDRDAPDQAGAVLSEPEQLARVIRDNFGINVRKVEDLEVVTFNSLYKIHAEEAVFVVKAYGANYAPPITGSSSEHVRYETTLLDALSGDDDVVILPVPSRSGASVFTFGQKQCLMFPFVEGTLYQGRDEETRAAAAVLARIHRSAIERWPEKPGYGFADIVKWWLEPLDEIARWLEANEPELHEKLNQIRESVDRAAAHLVQEDGLIFVHNHGDLSPRNFFFGEGRAVIFDFQASYYGPRIADLADAGIEFSLNGGRADDARRDLFVRTYTELEPLEAKEQALLREMLLLQAVKKLIERVRLKDFKRKVYPGPLRTLLELAVRLQAGQNCQ